MTAPGAGDATSAGSCTAATPCFVCKLKAMVAAQGVSAQFSDAPYAINLVGCRRANSISDRFDDRMIAFFSLPAEEARKGLEDAGIEAALLDDIAAAAGAVNGKIIAGRGVRRVACSSIELEPGKPASGHRVVAMFPITTDPGLVRLAESHDAHQKELETAVGQRDARLKDLKAGKKELEEKLLPELEQKGAAVNKLPKPRKGEAKSAALTAAEADLAAAKKAIDDFAKRLSVKPVPAKLDAQIEAVQKERDSLQAQLTSWASGELTKGEKDAFEGYRYAFRGPHGWEGDAHAFFPLGHHPGRFVLGQHHGNSDKGAVALTVGYFLGKRMLTGKLLKKDFTDLFAWPLEQRRGPALKKAKDEQSALAQAHKKALAELDKANAALPAKDRKAKHDALAAQQKPEVEKLAQKHAQAADEASREYVVVSSHRKAAGAAVPAGAWVVLACEVAKPGGTEPLHDDDQFEIKGDARGKRTGREVRLHYYSLAGKHPEAGLEIHAHHPAGDRAALPAGSKIMPGEPALQHGAALVPIRDGDQFEVEAMIGGTNVHRGHVLNVSGDSLSATAENATYVHNWSTGCQVFWAFKDFNLFILLCGLSRRWKCVGAGVKKDCARTTAGSDAAPDPATWKYAKTKLRFPPDALVGSIKADVEQLQKDLKAAGAGLKAKVDAWYKTQKGKARPKSDDAAATEMAAALDKHIAELTTRLDAEKAANAANTAEWQKADAERQALAKERKELGDAIALRGSLGQELESLEALQKQMSLGGSVSYEAAATELTELKAALDAQLPQLAALPRSKKAAEGGSTAIPDAITALKKACHVRAVKLTHDWMRTCDLAEACSQRFSYTLIELVGADASGKLQSVDKLEADFAKKVGAADANPTWSGFNAP